MPDLVKWNEAELAAIARQGYIRRAMATYGGLVARDARGSAPRSTNHHSPPPGHGADSIQGRTVLESGEWTARIGWDVPHAYMRFPERREHFLRRAATTYGRTP